MDADRFDTFTRSLTIARSRREVLAALLGGALGLLGLAETIAKKGKGKKKKGKKKGGNSSPPPPPPQSPPSPSCANGTELCEGICVNTGTDPRNCGSCGKRCQINATCDGGTCTCVKGACSSPELTCCPASSGTKNKCSCRGKGGPLFTDSSTCADVTGCPAERQCFGRECQTCCTPGTSCDPNTGACLRD
jgi:Stigma-specific protein, Stig1